MAQCFTNLGLLFLACFLMTTVVSGLEYRVGGVRGWTMPTGEEKETYNHWASRNRFRVGDSLYFKYREDDSVVVVDRNHYARCNTTNPIQRFTDGNTTVTFNRYGFFYFITGKLDHCRSGQKLIVRVMVHPGFDITAPAPEPYGGGNDRDDDGAGPTSAPMPNSGWIVGTGGSSSLAMAVITVVALFPFSEIFDCFSFVII